jgi:hypothetical protein
MNARGWIVRHIDLPQAALIDADITAAQDSADPTLKKWHA